MDRERSHWSAWATRLLSSKTNKLMQYADKSKNRGLIKKADNYNITRYALSSLLATLDRQSKINQTETPNH